MKKLNGILILIGAFSIAVLALLIYSTGVFSHEKEAEATPTPIGAKENTPRDDYEDDYSNDPDRNKEIAVIHVIENFSEYKSPSQIYTYGFQKDVRKRINELVKTGDYTEDNPLVILNPFCTNSQSLYVYFETDEPCAVSYNVHISELDSEAEDFGGNVVASKTHMNYEDGCEEDVNTSLIHEFAVTGIQPDADNIISFRLVDTLGRIRMKRFYYTFKDGVVNLNEAKLIKERATKTIVVDEKTLETQTVNESDTELTAGLYCVFRGRNGYDPYMLVYDNDGYMRMEVPLVTAYAREAYVKDGEMYLFVSNTKFVKISAIGEVKDIYESDEFIFGEDYCIDENGNVVVLASKVGADTADDTVCIIDFKKEAVYMLFDMGELLPGLKKKKACKDWLKLSSISYNGDNMVVLSADEEDILIKVRRIYNGPRLVYLAGDDEYFEDLPSLKKMFFYKEGDYTFPSTVTESGYEEYDKIRQSRSYIWVLDQNLDYEYEKKEEHFGYYTRLLIDDDERTVRSLDESVVIKGLNEKTRLVNVDGNRLLVKGNESVFCEMDYDFNTIYTFTYKPPVVEKTIEQQDYEEDNPPPDDSVFYIGISKINPVSYLFTDEIVIHVPVEEQEIPTGETET